MEVPKHSGSLSILLACLCALVGCRSPLNELTPPQATVAPYQTGPNEVLWAIAPLRNTSQSFDVDVRDLSDTLVAATEQVRGVRCLPVSRTLHAMDVLGMQSLETPDDARKLAASMGVDGLIIGEITAYDPYTPRLGIALAFYSSSAAITGQERRSRLDPRTLSWMPTDYNPFPSAPAGDEPLCSISEMLDGKNHQVQADIRAYALGRSRTDTATGWRTYLASMPLFCEFASWYTVDRLVQNEWMRLSRQRAAGSSPQPR